MLSSCTHNTHFDKAILRCGSKELAIMGAADMEHLIPVFMEDLTLDHRGAVVQPYVLILP